jgi:hypothetical protein
MSRRIPQWRCAPARAFGALEFRIAVVDGARNAMTNAGVQVLAFDPRPVAASLPRRKYVLVLAVLGVLASVLLLNAERDNRYVLAPLAAVCLIVCFVLFEVRAQDGRLSACDVGVACVVASGLYAGMPLLVFYMMGMTWSPVSDVRMRVLDPTPAAWGGFAWGSVIYLSALAGSYVWFRRGRAPRRPGVSRPDSSQAAAILWCFVVARIILVVVESFTGVDLDPSYMDYADAMVRRMQLPYWSQQTLNFGVNVANALRFFVVGLAYSRWKSQLVRLVFYGWVTGEVVAAALRMGARNNAVLLVVATIVLYDRMVRPVPVRRLAIWGCAALVGFTLLGMMRSTEGDVGLYFTSNSAFWSGVSEFPATAVTAFDLDKRVNLLGRVPWQAQFGEFFAIIPSQLLPFQKMDLSLWYIEVLGNRDTTGYMFGVIAQSVIGWGWPELIVRGMFLGWAFGRFHRAYSRQQTNFAWTMLYTFVTVWSFYTYRSNTLSPIVMIVYCFLPATFIVWAAARVLPRGERGG